MGKVFPLITNLKEKPSLFEPTLKLIEKSFKYQAPFHYKEDFAPLMHPSNHHNCFVLIDENEKVLAHIGVREKFLRVKNRDFSLTMLGGIAVDEDHRGEGHFHTLMSDVLAEKRSDTTFFILWSDQEKLYKKFGFFLCGDQFEFSQSKMKKDFIQTKYAALTEVEKNDIQKLYETSFQKDYLSPTRTTDDWKIIESVSHADLFVKKIDQKISTYFFMNKGQDLGGVIYEYGSQHPLSEEIKEIQGYGNVWGALPVIETELQQFQFLFCPSDVKLLTEFISAYTNDIIKIRAINQIKNEVYFDFNGETLSLEIVEFFRGMLGPGAFEELGESWKPIFISGLDSI